MSKLLFCVDHVFQRGPDNSVYTSGGKLPYSKWEEYLEFFDELIVVSRGEADLDGDLTSLSSGPRVSHHLLNDRRGFMRLTTLGRERAILKELVKEADAVIGRVPGEIGLAGCALAAKAGKPYLVELVACPWDALWNHGSAAAKAYAPLMARRTQICARHAEMVHYVTGAFLQRRYPTLGEQVSASDVVLPDVPADMLERRHARLQAIKGGAPITFGTIGAMRTRLKGIDLALRALAANRDRLGSFRYRVLGEGDPSPYQSLSERLGISDHVQFDGTLPPGDAIAKWNDGIDIYLQPSYQEGLSRALIEAMSRGCLAIGSTVGGNPELLPAERMHQPGDFKALGDAILRLIAQPEEALDAEVERNSLAARQHAYPHTLALRQQFYRKLALRSTGSIPTERPRTKLLFCVDSVFQRAPDGTIYTTGGKFPYSKWQEYLEFFDELEVVARGAPLEHGDASRLATSSGPRVSFHLFDDLRGLKRVATLRQQRARLKGIVAGADAVIGRIPSELGLAGCSYAAAAGKPHLIELVACPWDALWNYGSAAAKAYAPIMTGRTRNAMKRAPLAHYVTREFLQRRYPTQGVFVSASNVMLPTPEPDLLARRLTRLRAWRRGDRPLVLGTIGALHTSLKGIHLAIGALADARDRLPPFTYRVLGEGDASRLKALAEKLGLADRVHFDGVLPGPREVADWLDGIDLYLQPSFQEGLPRATIEAMNRACLAIGSTVGGIPELLPPERMHPPGDFDALGKRIEEILAESDAALEAEVRRNFETAQHYSYERSLAEKRRAYRALRDWVDRGGLPELRAADTGILPDIAA